MSKYLLFLLLFYTMLWADLPADLPGEEIDDNQYLEFILEQRKNKKTDTTTVSPTTKTREEMEIAWLDSISQGWEAPSLSQQIANDTIPVHLGMGAVFIPRMSSKNSIEPDITIHDRLTGDLVASGQTGKKYNLLPGDYVVFISSIPKISIYKNFTIREARLTPIIPDWCALKIEVINDNAKPIRGEYDIAKTSPLTPIGRGRGRDINLAEELRVWLLPEGTYKIIGPGTSYNAVSNFLTVRINSGEFLNYSIVQDETTSKILGGGIILENTQSSISSNWKHSINLGGSIDLGFLKNHKSDSTEKDLKFSMLLYDRLTFRKNKIDLNNLMKVDLTLALQESNDEFRLQTTQDELRLNSIFTYKLFPRIGPYGRVEYTSGLLPKRAYRKGEGSHYFLTYDEIPYSNPEVKSKKIISDSILPDIDSLAEEKDIEPAFSPMNIQSGIGGNVQLLRNRFINIRLLSGFGFTFEKKWDEKKIYEDDDLILDTASSLYKNFILDQNHTILERIDDQRFEYGPEFMLNSNLSLGRTVTVDTELRYFAPVKRISTPDLTISNLLSFHLTGHIILDYDYSFKLIQPEEIELQNKESRHRILLRFSFSK